VASHLCPSQRVRGKSCSWEVKRVFLQAGVSRQQGSVALEGVFDMKFALRKERPLWAGLPLTIGTDSRAGLALRSNRGLGLTLTLLLIVSLFPANCTNAGPKDDIQLWPEIEPFKTDYLKVSDIHEIYYELCGNPQGKPVFVLHGGPGASCTPYYRRFFNPDRFLIVLHDQRGAGKSKPFAELRENTTQNLVEDIEKLRKHLNLGKIILFGGSWGTTLALAYAETYPENVAGIVMRGVFTCTQEELDHYYHGGVRAFFPDAYDSLLAALPDPNKRPLPNYLFELIKNGDEAQKQKLSKAWAKYEGKIGELEAKDNWTDNPIQPERLKRLTVTLGLFENYYMANHCFLKEGQLLKDVDRINAIPIIMVNGRYDMICPPVTAYRLHHMLPKSKLVIAERAGHWMGEKTIEEALLKAMKEFE
jgi:proline iminopeptidase